MKKLSIIILSTVLLLSLTSCININLPSDGGGNSESPVSQSNDSNDASESQESDGAKASSDQSESSEESEPVAASSQSQSESVASETAKEIYNIETLFAQLEGFWNSPTNKEFVVIERGEDGTPTILPGIFDAGGFLPLNWVELQHVDGDTYELQIYSPRVDMGEMGVMEEQDYAITVTYIEGEDVVLIDDVYYTYAGTTFDDAYKLYQEYGIG